MLFDRMGRYRPSRLLLAFGLVAGMLGGTALPAVANDGGAVFTLSNAADGNDVLVYERSGDGTLTHVDTVATGGNGSGDGLGSQGSATLSDNGHWLFAVNAGSDSLSVFAVDGTSLTLTDTAASRGDRPISVDVHGDLVYVLNGASADVAGFRLIDGDLHRIRGAVRQLSGDDADPAQVEFSPDGESLVVTEKATNQIVAFNVTASGRINARTINHSSGETPFGFEFDPHGLLVISEAFGGEPDISRVATYALREDGRTRVIDSDPTTQTAACWIAVTTDGAYVYTTNTGSDTVSRFALHDDGSLELLGQTVTGDAPIDVDLSAGDGYLYVINAGDVSIGVYAVGDDGSLTEIQTVTGLPATGLGIAAS